jgi:7-cyano-7-deazaguanine synthase
MTKALVVLSGGQDSTTCLVWARAQYQEVHAVTFDYGQRHDREIAAATDVAKIIGVESHETICMGSGILHSTSPLTSGNELETYTDYQSMDAIIGDRVEKTFVPMRNSLFLTIAANRAVELGCSVIVTGVCQADNANYPDCRQAFIDKIELAINESLGQKIMAPGYIQIRTPLMNLSKAESIKMLHDDLQALAILAFTHTAYDGQYPPVSKDHANTLRAQGFLEAGLPDPLVLRAAGEGVMDLPRTSNYDDDVMMASMISAIEALRKVGL